MPPENEHPADCCPDLRAKFDDWKSRAEQSVREEPVKTAGLAFIAGICLTILPVGSLLSALVRIALALVRPALLLLGIVKLVEEYDRRK